MAVSVPDPKGSAPESWPAGRTDTAEHPKEHSSAQTAHEAEGQSSETPRDPDASPNTSKDVAFRNVSGVSGLVGRTPLVRLAGFEPRKGVEIFAKLESHNPGGSVKDRAALSMVLCAERDGELAKGSTIIEATSGNTGISLAMIAAFMALCLALVWWIFRTGYRLKS